MNPTGEMNLYPNPKAPAEFEQPSRADVELIRDHLALRRLGNQPTAAAPASFERLELASLD